MFWTNQMGGGSLSSLICLASSEAQIKCCWVEGGGLWRLNPVAEGQKLKCLKEQ